MGASIRAVFQISRSSGHASHSLPARFILVFPLVWTRDSLKQPETTSTQLNGRPQSGISRLITKSSLFSAVRTGPTVLANCHQSCLDLFPHSAPIADW